MIKKQASVRLKKNLSKAISLVFIVLFSTILLIAIQQMLSVIFNTLVIDSNSSGFTIDISPKALMVTGITVFISFFIIAPLRLSIKRWYMELPCANPPLSFALNIFSSIKGYLYSVYYSFVKTAILVLGYLILLFPSLFIGVIIRVQMIKGENTLGAIHAVLFFLLILFFVLSTLYAIYFFIGFFYSDYIFLSGKTQNPFKAISISMHISKHHKASLLAVFLSMLPYFLLCILIVPIIFVVPYAKCTFAFYANKRINAQ